LHDAALVRIDSFFECQTIGIAATTINLEIVRKLGMAATASTASPRMDSNFMDFDNESQKKL
jgi:hypothetical protein